MSEYSGSTAIAFNAGNIGDIVLSTPIFEALKEMNYDIHFVGKKKSVELLMDDTRITSFSTINPCWGSTEKEKDGPLSMLRLAMKLYKVKAKVSFNFGSHPIPNLLLALSGIPRRISLKWGKRNYFAGKLVVVNDGEKKYHQCERFFLLARELGYSKPEMPMPQLIVAKETKRMAYKMLYNSNINKTIITIHPGSNVEYKNLPIEEFGILAQQLRIKTNATFVFLGASSSEIEKARLLCSIIKDNCINLAGNISLPVMAAVLELSDLFIGNDSGPTHMAAATCGRVVSIFKCTDTDLWRPYGNPTLCRVFDLREWGYYPDLPWPPVNIENIRNNLLDTCISVLNEPKLDQGKRTFDKFNANCF
jgi:ADP-heptose:LPS heptosyltransferase